MSSFYELVDERQRKECEFAAVYKEQFNHGTPSHNHLALIALLYGHILTKEALLTDDAFKLEAAKRAFEAYSQERSGVAFDGSPIPDWDNVAPGVQEAWLVAVETVATMAIL